MITRILLLFTLIAGTRVHNMDSHHTLHHDSRTQVLCKKFTRYPEQLITRILCHFVQHDVLTENEYNALRGDFHTKFINGARGAVHSLQNTTHPWLRTLQRQHGSIVTQDTNGSVRIGRMYCCLHLHVPTKSPTITEPIPATARVYEPRRRKATWV